MCISFLVFLVIFAEIEIHRYILKPGVMRPPVHLLAGAIGVERLTFLYAIIAALIYLIFQRLGIAKHSDESETPLKDREY